MKKIYLLLALAAGLVTSCDMDKEPYDSIPDDEALQSVNDFEQNRNSLYSGLRSAIYGETYAAVEVQCDAFNAVIGFSNSLGEVYRWTKTNQESICDGVYANFQGLTARANFIIDGYNKLDMSGFSNEDVQTIRNIKGEAFFTRAYSLFMLAQYFCKDYEDETADDANSGVSYRLDYVPSSEPSTYPARYTLRQTYEQIIEDMDSAALYVNDVTEEASYGYITQNAITALRARVALAMDDYQTAINNATALIAKNDVYWLDGTTGDFRQLWQQDAGNETIFQLVSTSSSELPPQSGIRYLPMTTDGSSTPDYIPTKGLLDLYSSDDIRRNIYFRHNQSIIIRSTGAVATVSFFNKYQDRSRIYNSIGNKAEDSRFTIEPKVFRIAEMYLIAAEAYAQLNDTENGGRYLNVLKAARIPSFNASTTYPNAQMLMTEIKQERQREMVGEGTRLFDIKRWHDNLTRYEPQQEDVCLMPGSESTTNLTRNADDNGLVWPIPKHETDTNPKVVQNPGY